jgi:hypothetical protein
MLASEVFEQRRQYDVLHDVGKIAGVVGVSVAQHIAWLCC